MPSISLFKFKQAIGGDLLWIIILQQAQIHLRIIIFQS
ncbi:hypothetical protein ADIARSV_3421 [Arcticibacter svalbardensis MN12-7]|uniref:Uncharacterized protein n=1 Tax=Arcticibacter svalbardensis MN12-7 TaxID=1150600 RepID=R9GNC3_9SPHI|nr:hypothetical protein ADIARSV_3421 [Arcticibacter svalbardensis MN12-7]